MRSTAPRKTWARAGSANMTATSTRQIGCGCTGSLGGWSGVLRVIESLVAAEVAVEVRRGMGMETAGLEA